MHPASPSITTRTPGKVNLLLAVGECGDDGYHPVVSVYHAVQLYEDVTVAWAPEWQLSFRGGRPMPVTDDNLVLRAGRLLAAEATPFLTDNSPERLTASIAVRKRVPIAGGMAGGSADAAGTLVALAKLWRLDVPKAQLARIAAKLGSDVPFALRGGTSIGTGRGDRLAPVIAAPTFHWVMITRSGGLSTPAVYSKFDEMVAAGEIEASAEQPALAHAEAVVTALASGDAHALAPLLQDDLQSAAISLLPELQQTIDAGVRHGALAGIVSGSGPTVALLADSAHGAAALAQSMLARGHDARVVSGPTRGAHVLDADDEA